MPETCVGLVGGSGLYALFDEAGDAHAFEVDTPYGPPSAPLVRASVQGRDVVFLPRHGRRHEYPAHRVPYRANLWALHAAGVRQVLAPCAVGALDLALRPGDLVIPDQLLDRTSGRDATFHDTGAVHVPFADPYCPAGRRSVLRAAADLGWPAHDGGTTVVVNGPRFSTRAESRLFASVGGTVVNMTGQPEASLARELALCYTSIAVVTDVDAGLVEGDGVTQADVLAVFARSLERVRRLLLAAVTCLPAVRSCECAQALDGTDAATGQRSGADANSSIP